MGTVLLLHNTCKEGKAQLMLIMGKTLCDEMSYSSKLKETSLTHLLLTEQPSVARRAHTSAVVIASAIVCTEAGYIRASRRMQCKLAASALHNTVEKMTHPTVHSRCK